jgi:membrane protein YdbS with pleckstrin-like domain
MSNYKVQRDGVPIGEFSSATLRAMAAKGELLKTDLIQAAGSHDKWRQAGTIASIVFVEASIHQTPPDPPPVAEESIGSAIGRSKGAAREAVEALSFNQPELPGRLQELLYPREAVTYASRPSHAALLLQLLAGAIPWLIISIVVLGWVGIVLGVLFAIVLLPITLFVIYLKWKNTYYVITDSRTLVMVGIFSVRVHILQNHCVQFVSINTGIVDRWLGLNTVELMTAASHFSANAYFGGGQPGTIKLKSVNASDIIHQYSTVDVSNTGHPQNEA